MFARNRVTQITQRRLTVTSFLLDKIELGLSLSLSLTIPRLEEIARNFTMDLSQSGEKPTSRNPLSLRRAKGLISVHGSGENLMGGDAREKKREREA